MEFRILGPLEVADGEGRPVSIGGGRPRALLADLLLHANEVVSTDRLVDDLWGETPPETAAKALQGYVSHLRKALQPSRGAPSPDDLLLTRAHGYLLRVDPGRLDAHRFQELAAEGHGALVEGRPAEAATVLREALSLWRGPALSDFAYEAFAQSEIARLEELLVGVLEDRVEADLALGRHSELVGELESLVAQHPLRERLRGQLMLALYRSGRQAEALEAYRAARHALVEELGLEPSEELQRLQRAILAHDPSLAAPAGERAAPGHEAGRLPSVPARSRRRMRALAAIGALLVAGAVAAAVVQLTSGPAPAPVVVAPNSVAVIDPETNRVVGDVPVGSRPVAVAVGHGSVWVANADDGTVVRIDPVSLRIVKTIGIGAPAVDLAVGPDAVWVANGSDGTLSRIDPRLDAVVETIDLRGSNELVPNTTFAVAAGAGGVWVGSGEGTVLRLDPATGETVTSIDVGGNAVGLAVGEGAVWAAVVTERAVRIEPRTNTVTAEVSVGLPVTLAAGEGAVWVLDVFDTVWSVDPDTGAVTKSFSVGKFPLGVATGDGAVWVALNGDGTVSRIDPRTGQVAATVDVGHAPTDVAVGEGGVWVSVAAEPAT